MVNIINYKVKGWVKWLLPFYLLAFLPLLTSCSEQDDAVSEFSDWQQKNETYFEQQYQAHSVQSDTKFVVPSWKQASSKALKDIEHTECVLVDVLEKGPDSETDCPLYTDSVQVHYSGRLIPSAHYASGYEFDKSYLTTFDPEVDVPSEFLLSGNIVSGFSTALQHMHRGDHWRVIIPYQLGYGISEYNSIPGYSTLIFDIRLVDFWNP